MLDALKLPLIGGPASSRHQFDSFEDDADAAMTLVRSKFVLIEFRRNEQRLFGGDLFHRLTVIDGDIRIVAERVDMVNCDAPFDGIVVPF